MLKLVAWGGSKTCIFSIEAYQLKYNYSSRFRLHLRSSTTFAGPYAARQNSTYKKPFNSSNPSPRKVVPSSEYSHSIKTANNLISSANPKITSSVLSTLLNSLINLKEYDLGIKIYEHLDSKGASMNETHRQSYITLLRSRGEWVKLLGLYYNAKNSLANEKDPQKIPKLIKLLNLALSSLADAKKFDLFDHILADNIYYDNTTYDNVLDTYVYRNEWKKCIQFYNKITDLRHQNRNNSIPPLKIQHLNSVLYACYNLKQCLLGMKYIVEAESHGLAPDGKAFITVLKALSVSRLHYHARDVFIALNRPYPSLELKRIFNEYLQSQKYRTIAISEASMNMKSSKIKQIGYSTYFFYYKLGINIAYNIKDWILVEQIMKDLISVNLISKLGFDDLSRVVDISRSANRLNDVNKIIDKLIRLYDTSFDLTMEQLTTIKKTIEVEINSKSSSKSERTVSLDTLGNKQLQFSRHDLPSLDDIIISCRKSGSYRILEYFTDYLISADFPLSLPLLTKTIRYLGEANLPEKGLELILICKRKRGIDVNLIHISSLLQAFRQNGKWKMCYLLFQSLDEFNIPKTPELYFLVLKSLLESQQWEIAENHLRALVNSTYGGDSSNVESWKSRAFQLVLSVLGNNPSTNARAFALYQEFSTNPKLEWVHHPFTLATMLKLCKGNCKLAVKIVVDAGIKGHLPDIDQFILLILTCEKEDDFEIAVKLYEIMSYDRPIIELRKLLNSFNDNEENSDKVPTIDQQINSTPISRININYQATTALINVCERIGKWEYAVQLFESMLASDDPNKKPTILTFITIISIIVRGKHWDKALYYYNLAVPKREDEDSRINMLYKATYWGDVIRQLHFESLRIGGDESDFLKYEPELRSLIREGSLSKYMQPKQSFVADDNSLSIILPNGHLLANRVDLHGFTVHCACVAIYDILLQFFKYSEVLDVSSMKHDVSVITGRGNHVNSSGKRGVLRAKVESFIVDTIEPKGYLRTIGEENQGLFYISIESIKQWILEKSKLEKKSTII